MIMAISPTSQIWKKKPLFLISSTNTMIDKKKSCTNLLHYSYEQFRLQIFSFILVDMFRHDISRL
jgi:hypothetical protein